MAYYKDTENNIHFLDDDSFYHIIPAGCVKITDAEADSMQKYQMESAIAAIPESTKAKKKITDAEATQTPRRIREALLEIADKVGADCSYLRNLDANIAAERVKIK